MVSRIRQLPSPALVISAIALIVAIGGGSYAIGASDNAKDKKIATKVVKKLAPTLSVKHAVNADSATNAATVPDGAVTTAKLADGSVTGAKVLDGSLNTRDIAGTDVTGALDLGAVPANTCTSVDVGVPGAQPGDAILSSFVGSNPPPASVMIEPLKVTAADTVRYKACNPTISATSATSGIGIRVITLR
jgi:hypothetical protein